jgi:hypothetical protein
MLEKIHESGATTIAALMGSSTSSSTLTRRWSTSSTMTRSATRALPALLETRASCCASDPRGACGGGTSIFDVLHRRRQPQWPLPQAKWSVNMIVRGLKANVSRRRYNKDQHDIHLIHTKPSQPLRWSEQPITFFRADHWVHIPKPWSCSLVVEPMVDEDMTTMLMSMRGACFGEYGVQQGFPSQAGGPRLIRLESPRWRPKAI